MSLKKHLKNIDFTRKNLHNDSLKKLIIRDYVPLLNYAICEVEENIARSDFGMEDRFALAHVSLCPRGGDVPCGRAVVTARADTKVYVFLL